MKLRASVVALACSALVVACGDTETSEPSGGGQGGIEATGQGGTIGGQGGSTGGEGGASAGWELGPALPEPVANNAVAALAAPDGCVVLSAYGIGTGLSRDAIGQRAWLLRDGTWTDVGPVPGAPGRIAASAVALRGKFYVFGGYSVEANMSETSHPEMFVLDPADDTWSTAAPLPVAIDDAVAVAWRDRYIVVVSGWADIQAPVDDVQIYDVETNSWSAANPFPGTPVFGHAGAIDGDTLVVIDGVEGSGFNLVNQAWRATLDPATPTQIQWDNLGSHPPPTRYRAAAAEVLGELVFVGGADTPYNFDGLAYAGGTPVAPLVSTLGWTASGAFGPSLLPDKPTGTMDHRALARCDDAVFTVGGITAGPVASAEVWRHGL